MIDPCWIESFEESQSAGGGPRRSEPRVMDSSESLFAEAEFPMFVVEGDWSEWRWRKEREV